MIDALTGMTLKEGAPHEYTRALFDQYAYSYDQHMKSTLRYRVPQLLRQAISPFIVTTPEPWMVADIGCGTGLCAPLFADVAGKLIGVDISPNMIEVAKQRGGYYKLFVMDILSFLQGEENTFDLIIAADVFVYFGDLNDLFKACDFALKTNGLLTFSIESLKTEEVAASPSHPDFQLRKTGRYAHHPDYIQLLSTRYGLTIVNQFTDTIRYQEDTAVQGSIYVLSKKPVSTPT
jgi:predicted TPR repeat methyltransferase